MDKGAWQATIHRVTKGSDMTLWLNEKTATPSRLVLRAVWFSSVQFSRSVVSDSLWPHESQHARPPCPSPSPGVHSNSCPSSRWCHPANSSSVVPFSSCLQSFPASGSFKKSQFFASGGFVKYRIFSFSISPSNEDSGLISFRIDWFYLLAVQMILKSLLQYHSSEGSILQH